MMFTRVLLVSIVLTLPGLLLADTELAGTDPRPNADYSPEEVVAIVVDALQQNPNTENDAGIRTVFAFASPSNRAFTGPLARFTSMIKGGFSDMLGFRDSRFESLKRQGNRAVRIVWLVQDSGKEVGYAFQVARQEGGDHDGMWMTESVVPLGESNRSGTSI
jgi:hypothetical protein